MKLLEAVTRLTQEQPKTMPGYSPWFISYRDDESGVSFDITPEMLESDRWACAVVCKDDIFNHKLKKFMKQLAES